MTDRIWSCGVELELSRYKLCRPFPLHFHEELIVVVIIEGTEALLVDGVWHRADEGTVVVIEPERAHSNAPVGEIGARYIGFYAKPSLLRRVGALVPRRLRTPLLRNTRIARRLVELHRSLEPNPPTIASEETAVEIARVSARVPEDSTPHVGSSAVIEAAAILRQRCCEHLAWPMVAESLGVSPAHLARLFRNHFGIPPHAYQAQFRIARAKAQLRGGARIASVAASCGFVDQSHLTQAFTRFVGQTPGVFAAAQKTTRQPIAG
jgi:AraC-like DNA-binding protein